jgi:hypothetical protein
MLRLLVLPFAFSFFLAVPAPKGPVAAPDQGTPVSSCKGTQVDLTDPGLSARLPNFSLQAVGEPQTIQLASGHSVTQLAAGVDDSGNPTSVEVTCTSTGCISSCTIVGCNPVQIQGQWACSAVQCVNSSGFPCGTGATCSKTVKVTGGS